jgi:hypothetical protein
VAGSWFYWCHHFTSRNKWINWVELMDRAIWIKLVASAFWGIADVLLITGCCQERNESAAFDQPQYRSTDRFVPTDVGSQQITTTSPDRPLAQKESVGISSTLPTASTDTQLDNRIDLSAITIGTPLGRAIEILRNSTHPPLNIVVFWNDLRDNARIDQHTPIGAEPVPGVSLRKNLEILLASLPAKLDYAVIDGVVVIATKDSLPKKMLRCTYDITDLSARPADYHSGTSGAGVATPGR